MFYLSDVLTGFGLSALLEFSRTSPDMPFFFPICLGVLPISGILALYIKPPAWVSLCNATFALVITLSLALNLLSQLYPNGKELSLIPAYVLLCIPRMSPSGRAWVLQCGLTLLVLVFAIPASSVRPDGDVGVGLSLAVSVGVGSLLQFNDFEYRVVGVVGKGLVLVALGALRMSFYHFFYDRPNTVRVELFVSYGVLLLFACMQAASAWFGLLKEVLGQVQWRLVVRIQHILNAFIVAAAWVYPLQLHSLRVLLLLILLALNLFFKKK